MKNDRRVREQTARRDMPEDEIDGLVTTVRRDPLSRLRDVDTGDDYDAIDRPPPGWARTGCR
jgi:hypothetical protein